MVGKSTEMGQSPKLEGSSAKWEVWCPGQRRWGPCFLLWTGEAPLGVPFGACPLTDCGARKHVLGRWPKEQGWGGPCSSDGLVGLWIRKYTCSAWFQRAGQKAGDGNPGETKILEQGKDGWWKPSSEERDVSSDSELPISEGDQVNIGSAVWEKTRASEWRGGGSPGGSGVKNPPANAGDMGLISDSGGSHRPHSN